MIRLIVGLLVLSGSAVPSALAQDKVADFIVARVNAETITSVDILKQIGPSLEALDANPEYRDDPAKLKRLKVNLWTDAVRAKVEEVLALQSAKRLGIQVAGKDVKARYDSLVKEMGGDERMSAWASERGLTLAEVRSMLRKHMTIDKLLKQKLGYGARGGDQRRQAHDSYIRPSQLRRYYERHKDEFREVEAAKSRRILLTWAGKTPQEKLETRKLASSLLMLLGKGANFRELARLHKPAHLRDKEDDPEPRFVGRRVLRAELDEMAFSLPVGSVSPPIETEEGIYILHVIARRPARTIPFDEAQLTIRQKLEQKRMQSNLRKIQAELRANASIWPPNLFERKDYRILEKK